MSYLATSTSSTDVQYIASPNCRVSPLPYIDYPHHGIYLPVEVTLTGKYITWLKFPIRSAQMFSAVENLTLEHELLMSFSNMKTLRIDHRLVVYDRTMREVTFTGSGDVSDAFIDARQNAGHPVTLVRNPGNSESSSTSGSSKAGNDRDT